MVDFWKRQALSQCEEQRLRAIGYSYQQITEEYNGIKRRYYEHIQKCGLKRDDVSARYYQLENTIQAINHINNGISPVNINWYDVLYSWQIIDDKLRCYYDLQTLYYIVNNVDIEVDKLLIIDAVIAQLKARNQNIINAETFLEYLPQYRGIVEISLRFVPANQQKQEQVYSIPTNLTEEQLKRILKSLKTEGFVAPEQTEEDFLNSFEIEGRKPTNQGKINWIKEARNRKISPKQIVDFCVLFSNSDWFDKKDNSTMVQLLSAIFGVNTDIKRISAIRKESHSELYNTMQSLINVARNSAKI